MVAGVQGWDRGWGTIDRVLGARHCHHDCVRSDDLGGVCSLDNGYCIVVFLGGGGGERQSRVPYHCHPLHLVLFHSCPH